MMICSLLSNTHLRLIPYLPDIENDYSILNGFDITPIFDGSNGDTFWVLLSNENESKFVHFELEADEIYDDYGSSFNKLLANLVIDLYENMDDLESEELVGKVKSLGFEKAKDFIESIRSADEKELRMTTEDDEKWRKENIPMFI